MSIDLVRKAKVELEDALKPLVDTPAGLRNMPYGVKAEPPATVVGPPKILWSGYQTDASEADFTVYVVVAFNERAVDNLLSVVEAVVQAIESGVVGATVGDVTPSNYDGLASFTLPVNVVLS